MKFGIQCGRTKYLDEFSEQKRKAFGSENIFHDYEEEQQKKFNKKRNNHTKLLVLFFIISATSIFIIIKRKASSSKNKFAEKWSIFEASDIIGLIKHKCESESDLNANNVSTSMISLTDDDKRNLEEEINICFDKFTYKIKPGRTDRAFFVVKSTSLAKRR